MANFGVYQGVYSAVKIGQNQGKAMKMMEHPNRQIIQQIMSQI